MWQEEFEQNMLDGDSIDDCGGAMLSAKSVLEFFTELRKKDKLELIKMLPKYSKHNDYCEFLEDSNMPCDCGVSQYNLALMSCEQLIKDYYKE